jgi:hypothetical protein
MLGLELLIGGFGGGDVGLIRCFGLGLLSLLLRC